MYSHIFLFACFLIQKYVLCQNCLFHGEVDRVKEGERREYIRLRARKSNYLWTATCTSHHIEQESSGERRNEDKRERKLYQEKKERKKERAEILWPKESASQLSLWELIRLIWVNRVLEVMPCIWNFEGGGGWYWDFEFELLGGRDDMSGCNQLLRRVNFSFGAESFSIWTLSRLLKTWELVQFNAQT